MPSRSFLEKSPIDPSEYEGLQVDTRAKDNRDPFLDESKAQGYLDDDFDNHDNYMNEKQAHITWGHVVEPKRPKSPHCTDSHGTTYAGSPLPAAPQPKTIDGVFCATNVPPEPQTRRICGLKKKPFWEIFGLVLALIIAAAVVGGVVGGLQAENVNVPPAGPGGNTTTAVPAASNFTQVSSADVLADSPLNIISYDAGGDGDPDSRQCFRIYYQSVTGHIQEAISNGQDSWQIAAPIFTDALNNTGLATVTYLNGTQQQGSIFYVGLNGLIQEKRKIFNNTLYWEPGTFNDLNLAAVGNITVPSESTPEPKNGVRSYAMAAVYSQNFTSGAGIRLFYHAELLNGTSYVQEMVWTQAKDSWNKGAQIPNVWPKSKLAATIDENNSLLRLFFTSGSEMLQEVYCDITDARWKYQNGKSLCTIWIRQLTVLIMSFAGMNIANYLDHNTADLSAISENGKTYLYHYASINQTANVGIHELAINGIPGSFTNQESYNLSEPLVSDPQLTLPSNGQSAFQPLTAAKTVVPGVARDLFVFWADKVTGDPNALSGYQALLQTRRPASNPIWPTTQPMLVPLSSTNSLSSRKRSLSSRLSWIL